MVTFLTTARATKALVVAIGAVAALTGLVVLGPSGIPLTLIGFAILVSRRSHAGAGRTAMRALGARAVARWEAPQLVDIVATLAARAGLPRTPTVALLPGAVMNAVATGTPGDAVIAVTPSLLRTLPPRELTGVLAHEISHIRSGDIRVLSVGRSLASFTQTMSMTATVLLLLVGPSGFAIQMSLPALLAILWAPTAATMLLLALSRIREHAADDVGAELTGDPEGLARALWRLDRANSALLGGHPLSAANVPALLRTHPTTSARLERLRMIKPRHPLPGSRPLYFAADDLAPPTPAI